MDSAVTRLIATLLLIGFASVANAQTNITFGTLNADPTAPIEMSADSLNVSQTDGSAVFSGNVVIGQGVMRIAAQRVVVTYKSGGGIDRLDATGGVTFVTGSEAAEATSAEYSITDQTLIMRGDVLLKQGQNALSADTMRIDLSTGAAQMQGRVRTILNAASN